jgi:hypothetical protein
MLAAAALIVVLIGLSGPAFASRDTPTSTQAALLASPAWVVRWSPPDENSEYIAIVRFRLESGALTASTEHPNGTVCYPDIQVHLLSGGFLFFGCTGVPKVMRHDPADAAAPFKGRAFGFRYRWQPAK